MNYRLLTCLLITSIAHAAPTRTVHAFEVHATIDKKDATLHFEKGMIAAMINKESPDGIIGVTSDFPGGPVRSHIVFNASVPEEKLMALANFQGHLAGTVQCQRVRLGSSPLYPDLKVAVLAEGCTIKSINH